MHARTRRHIPGARLTNTYPWTVEILLQPLVVLDETTELELRHGLFLRTGVHLGQGEMGNGGDARRGRETRRGAVTGRTSSSERTAWTTEGMSIGRKRDLATTLDVACGGEAGVENGVSVLVDECDDEDVPWGTRREGRIGRRAVGGEWMV